MESGLQASRRSAQAAGAGTRKESWSQRVALVVEQLQAVAQGIRGIQPYAVLGPELEFAAKVGQVRVQRAGGGGSRKDVGEGKRGHLGVVLGRILTNKKNSHTRQTA